MRRHLASAAMAMLLVAFALGLCFTVSWPVYAAEGSKPAKLATQSTIQPKAGDPVDVAPFGEPRTWEDGKDIGILWEDHRDIFTVRVTFADAASAPDPASVKLQYWLTGGWPKNRVPREKNSGADISGWLQTGDWFKGKWQEGDTELKRDGATWTYTFRPANEKEFPDLGFKGVFRTTTKLRLFFEGTAPRIAALHAFSDSAWDQTTAVLLLKEGEWDGSAEAFNGYISDTQPSAGAATIKVWYVKPVAAFSRDESVVTIRSPKASFSFAPREVAEGERVFVRDLGVLVRPENDKTTYADAEAAYQKAPKARYDMVTEMPEQTLARAWSDMPPKGRIYMPIAFEGGRQHFGLRPNGNLWIDCGWQRRIKSTDSDRCKWEGRELSFNFDIPRGGKTGASIESGDLPIPTTWYETDGIRYTQTCFATMLTGKVPPGGRANAEDPQVLMVRFALTNTTSKAVNCAIPIAIIDSAGAQQPVLRNGVVYAKSDKSELARMYINANGADVVVKDGSVVYSVNLPAGEMREFFVSIPSQTLDNPEEIGQLAGLAYGAQHKMVANYWRKRQSQSCQIVTPEPLINQFYSANSSHQLINTENEVGTNERAMVKVGTFHYGAYTNESVMMTTDIDRRGYFDVSRKAYESWLHYQGSVSLPGDYATKDGIFYGVNGYESGGYNQHHGWALWGMGEHYWFTRDKAWLQRAAPSIIKACDWITNERKRTTTDEYTGIRAIERGMLPQGSLEDISDWRCWMTNNVMSYWGMENAARALADIGDPSASRLLKEAAAYKSDIRKQFFEAMVRTPVARLRDGTYVPIIPSEIHRRGRSVGWITETLEGSIHMIRCGIVDPDEQVATWIMKDYEDNRYLAPQYGYQVPFEERNWFSLGGFSQQPSLLCSPTPYLMRDEPKHYLRAYFNAFAAGYFPERAMITEHPLPNLGDYAGDHFKSSDEAMNSSWLRWMFIWDEGEDLHLGKMMPRYWLADGQQVSITRSQTHFGPMSMSMKSFAASGRIEMTIDPPTRDAPGAVYARFRHPDGKSMNRVTVNGKTWTQFDPEKEWVILPPLKEKTVVTAYYE